MNIVCVQLIVVIFCDQTEITKAKKINGFVPFVSECKFRSRHSGFHSLHSRSTRSQVLAS